MPNTLPALFTFDDLKSEAKAATKVKNAFKKEGEIVAKCEVSKDTKRQAGISYKEVHCAMADGQSVILRVKNTGDIFAVLLSSVDKPKPVQIPIKNQGNQTAAFKEIVSAIQKRRTSLQRRLKAINMPATEGGSGGTGTSETTSTGVMVKVEEKKQKSLEELLEEAKAEVERLKAAIASTKADTQRMKDEIGGTAKAA